MHDEWEGGERHGVAWRRVLSGVAVLAVAGALTWTALQSEPAMIVQTDRNPIAGTSEEPDVVLQRPVRAGARWLCGPEHPVRAFASGLFYTPEHPATPQDTVKPTGCFLSAEWAEAGGYELAPTPQGALRVGSLYLVPSVAPSMAACGDLAAIVDFVVPCPGRLPAPGRGMSCVSSCLFYGQSLTPGVVIEQRGFLLPADWCEDCEGQVVVAAVRDRTPVELISCGPAMARAAHEGQRVSGYHDCPRGPEWLPGIAGYPHERHTLLVWEDGPVTYAVSMEGHSAEIRSVLRALRADLAFVTPQGA